MEKVCLSHSLGIAADEDAALLGRGITVDLRRELTHVDRSMLLLIFEQVVCCIREAIFDANYRS